MSGFFWRTEHFYSYLIAQLIQYIFVKLISPVATYSVKEATGEVGLFSNGKYMLGKKPAQK